MDLSRFLMFCGCALLLASCAGFQASTTHAPRGFWRPNRSDRHGLETGRWRTYYDEANRQPCTAGRYKHGRPVRTFRYYAPTGQLDRSEAYGRDGLCEVTYWHSGGQVARRGHAQWVTGKGRAPRFYWYGTWTSYSPEGQTTAVQTYTDGTITRAEDYEQGRLTRVETYEGNRRVRTESYSDGQLIKVETFDHGRRTGTTQTL